jgi:hypothetical protein
MSITGKKEGARLIKEMMLEDDDGKIIVRYKEFIAAYQHLMTKDQATTQPKLPQGHTVLFHGSSIGSKNIEKKSATKPVNLKSINEILKEAKLERFSIDLIST